jgi:Fe-S oxidoreductase
MPEVVHHTQWLAERLASGALRLDATKGKSITFHDPCYLARANSETNAPRQLLDTLFGQNRREMATHGMNASCCGGGGGQLWLDVPGNTRVETLRARQIEATGVDTVATGCPFCRVMLEAGRGGLPEGQGQWRVQDVAELVAEHLSHA